MFNKENISAINFSEPFNKNEKIILKSQKRREEFMVEFSKENELNIKDISEAYNFLRSFNRKKLTIHYNNFSEVKIKEISIISSYEIFNERFLLYFSKEYLYLMSNLSTHLINSLKTNFLFNKKKTILLYSKFQNLKSNKNIRISLEELRETFSATEIYKRIYDFEKKILLPAIRDIEENTYLKISYSKIKESEINPNSKIIALDFYIIDMLDNKLQSLLSKIENSFKSKGIEFLSYREKIKGCIEVKGEEYFKDNFNLVAKLPGDFIANLFKALEEDWFNNSHKIYRASPVLEFQKQLPPTRSITSYIYEVSSILNRKFPDSLLKKLPLFFLKNIQSFKENDFLEFKTKNYKLFITMNDNYTTTIKLFKNNNQT